MQILGLLGMFFDAAVVFVTKFSLLFSLALDLTVAGEGIELHMVSRRCSKI